MIHFKEENVREAQRSFRPIRSTKASVNMVYTVEFLEEDALKQYASLAKNDANFPMRGTPAKGEAIQIQLGAKS